MAFALHCSGQEDTSFMWNLIKQFLVFRVGQAGARGTARMLGFGKLGLIVGLIGGYRAWKRHRVQQVA